MPCLLASGRQAGDILFGGFPLPARGGDFFGYVMRHKTPLQRYGIFRAERNLRNGRILLDSGKLAAIFGKEVLSQLKKNVKSKGDKKC